jgi:proton-translocating NADH-quinone oxidoreductase chain N
MIISSTDLPLYIAAVLAAIALIIVVISSIGARSKTIAMGLSTAGFVFAIVFIVLQAIGFFGPAQNSPGANSIFAVDWISYIVGIAVLVVSLLVGLTAVDYFSDLVGTDVSTFYALLVFTTIGTLLLVFSANLLMMFVAWEMMSIPSYVLTGFKKKDPSSNEAAVKYFLISAFSSAVLLYGISLIYFLTGNLSIYQVVQTLGLGFGSSEPIGFLALTFFVAGFGIKLAAVPFHMWIPDAYQGAPTIVSALLSTATKGATFAPAIRVLFVMFSYSAFQPDWTLTFAVLSVLSMTLGNFAALTQSSVKRILAYSSIGQAGYIMIGLAAGGELGLAGSFFHILNYAVMQSCAFIATALIIQNVGSDDLNSFNGIGKKVAVAPLALTLSLLALGGFPPLNGFWSKFVLFLSAFQSSSNLSWLAIVAIINSFVSIAFYLRIVKHMYLDEGNPNIKIVETNGFKTSLILSSIVIVATGIYPGPLIQFANIAASSFIAEIQSAPKTAAHIIGSLHTIIVQMMARLLR